MYSAFPPKSASAYKEMREPTLIPASHSSFANFIRSSINPSPTLATNTSVALLRPRSFSLCIRIEKTRSTPTLTPTHGILPTPEDLPAAAEANIPTRSSYLPPAAIDPTPTWDSSISSSSSLLFSDLGLDFLGLGGGFVDGSAEVLDAAGGAEPSTTAS
ncbi:hypothetical protein BN14_07062 [Rhizoctonia solani AG-1 IB]|uniref:Uncharacterized protein n=1 Tax=Thanatephorus cucumeris (strain AG1-IB / isolate 7/3/14) TaxID=1108050 RepID=M5C1Z3_THACB|nr:hypothetical protein BN14_07062 [Rhizoctonia solani AG-1 IB]